MPVWGQVISAHQVADLVAYIRAGLPSVPGATPAPGQGAAVEGASLYQRYGCVNCHGPNALGGVPNPQSPDKAIPALSGADFFKEFNTDEKIIEIIRTGSVLGRAPIVSMPHWGGIIPDSQLRALVAYIKTLKPASATGARQYFPRGGCEPLRMPRESTDALLGLHEWKGAGLSAQDVRERPHDYAVVWRTGDGPTSSGKLEVGDDHLVLEGSDEPARLRIPFDELTSVEIGRGTAERISGDKTLVLERHSCERVLVAALGGVGLLGELTDLLARLRAERAARACVAVVVPIRRGTAESAQQLIEEGPPFDVEGLGLERHHVFVSEREVVFFFEGESATAAVEALSQSPRVLKAAVRWRGILAGRPRLAEERFGWTRTS